MPGGKGDEDRIGPLFRRDLPHGGKEIPVGGILYGEEEESVGASGDMEGLHLASGPLYPCRKAAQEEL